MTSTQSTTTSHSPAASDSSSSSSSWMPRIPAPLQRLFDAVPLLTYPPNELPYRSPAADSLAAAAEDLPTLHVFVDERDAARGAPSFNPSCLKWQTFFRLAQIPHHIAPSTNHASPTGSLPFLLPAIPHSPEDRLDPRPLLPIPSSRFDTCVRQQQQQQQPSPATATIFPSFSSTDSSSSHASPDTRQHRQQAYEALLTTPIRNAWLYTLYLSPPNTPLLHALYINPTSRSSLIRHSLLNDLRAAARAEIAKSITSTKSGDEGGGWKLSGNLGAMLTWILARKQVLDPVQIYDEARRAFAALETLLGESGNEEWFFGAETPSLFDAAVFSYTYLILHDEQYNHQASGESEVLSWRDDTLRRILVDECPRLVAHVRRIRSRCWEEGA